MRVYLRFACPSGSRSVAPGGSHPFQEPRATGVSPLLGVGSTRRRDTLVPHVSSDRRDSSPGQTNDPFPLFHRKQGKANVISSRFPAFLARWEHSVACPRMNVFPLSTRFLQVGRGVPAEPVRSSAVFRPRGSPRRRTHTP